MNYIDLKREGPIAIITFQAPHVKNALIQELKEELWQSIKKLEYDSTVKVLIFTGSNNSFCAGGDIKAMLKPYDAKSIYDGMSLSTTIIEKLRRLPLITIAAVNGHAAGAGISIALSTDFIVAEEQSKWILAFKNVGLVPDLGLHYYLPQIVGEKRAKQWIFEGKTLTAQECLDHGLISEVVKQSMALERALQYAFQLLDGPIDAFIQSRLLINNNTERQLVTTMKTENTIQTLLRGGQDHLSRVEPWRK